MKEEILKGSAAGFVATIPMSVAMLLMHQALPTREKYPLPPEEITEEMAGRVDADDQLGESGIKALTIANHFSYGSIMGGIFSLLTRKAIFPRMAGGMVFGLLVWAASYLGWLPAFNILTPATQHPPRRNLLMIAAHLIWGAVLGAIIGSNERKPGEKSR